MNDHDIQGPPAEAARPRLEELEHAKRPARRLTVLTVSEVRHLLAQLP